MKHLYPCLSVLLFLLTTASLTVSQPDQRPASEALETLQPKVENALSIVQNNDIPFSEKQSRIGNILDDLFQYRLMGKLVLGREHWSRMSERLKRRYVNLYAEKMKISYLRKLSGINDIRIQFGEPMHTKKNKVDIPAELQLPGNDIQVTYRLYQSNSDSSWKVYDIKVEGVSTVKSYRSQYCAYLANHSISALLKQISLKVQELQDQAI